MMRFRFAPHSLFKIAQLYLQITGKRFNAIREQVIRERFINVPLVFISQLSRSGGTMLCQLFDGHNNCAVFPPELKLGPHKTMFEDLNTLAGTSHREAAIKLLDFNRGTIRKGIAGNYKKGLGNNDPFIFDLFAFRILFKSLWLNRKPKGGRDVMDIWFSSFFSSWLNYQWPREIKYCTAFASWTMVNEENVDKFFAYYPDGYLIHVMREPVSWYESVKIKSGTIRDKYKDKLGIYMGLENAVEWYKKQASVFERDMNKYPERVILLTYDSLISDRERVMREICKIIDINFEDTLLHPTFNRLPGGKNTSFRNGQSRDVLNEKDRERVLDFCNPVYERLAAVCI